jgi:hypothetical protein
MKVICLPCVRKYEIKVTRGFNIKLDEVAVMLDEQPEKFDKQLLYRK